VVEVVGREVGSCGNEKMGWREREEEEEKGSEGG